MSKDFALLLDLYELTMAQGYFYYKKNTMATFDLFARQLPPNRSYLVAAGLDDVLGYIKNLNFTHEDINFLKNNADFSRDFLDYLKNFRFKGEIWAMPEGTVFFANEPILRVTAPIIEAQIIESYLLNSINLQTMIASKASRIFLSAGARQVYDFSLRRTHGAGAAVKVGRASYLAGFSGTSNVLAAKLYKIPAVGTMAHSFVMSFKHEMDSFLVYANVFPDKAILLVDTYDIKKGIENAITVGLYLKEQGYRLQAIRIDSGNIVFLSRLARRMLDRAGLDYVKIIASGNLDEFKIKQLIGRGAQVDSFGVGTNMGTSNDAPSLDVIYKISEITDDNGNFLPKMKLSQGKTTYPGRKQVFRIVDRKKRFIKDVVALSSEKIKGQPLLKKVVDNGKVIYNFPSLEKTRGYLKDRLGRFSEGLRSINEKYDYPVEISPGLKRLQFVLARQLRYRQ